MYNFDVSKQSEHHKGPSWQRPCHPQMKPTQPGVASVSRWEFWILSIRFGIFNNVSTIFTFSIDNNDAVVIRRKLEILEEFFH